MTLGGGDCPICRQGETALILINKNVVAYCPECDAVYESPQALALCIDMPEMDSLADGITYASTDDLYGTPWQNI